MINSYMKLNNFLEKLDKDSDMGDYIKDFYKSDAPQFKGKSKKKRRQMAIAAKLSANESKNDSLKALARHVKEGVPLPDSLFRYQSEAYFDTFKQAKQLREIDSLPELDWESEEMLSTDIGESVVLENGEVVWLDVPYLYEEADEYECSDCGGSGLDMDDPTQDCAYCGGDGLVDSPEMYYAKGMTAPKPIRPIRKIDDKRYIQMYRKLYDTYVKPGKVPYAKLPALIDDYIESLIKKKVLTANDRLDPAERLAIFSKFVDTIDEGKSPHKKGTKKYKKHMAAMHAGESVTNEAEFSDLQQAYDKVYQLTDKMGDEALEQMNRYAPQFSDALEKHGDIESIEQNDSANVQDYIKELDYVLFQLGESINEAEYNDAYDNENELEVAKILGNALKKKDWYQFSPQELFSELESVNVDLADLINRIAKINYGVRLQENKQIDEVAPLVAMAGWAVLRTAATQGLKWTAKQALKRPITTGLTADLALNDGKVTSEVIDKVTDVINDNIEDPLPDLTPDFLEPFIGKPWATAGLLAAFFIGAGALRLWLDKRKDVIDNEEAEKLIDLRNLAGQKAKEMTATNEGTRCWKGYKKKGMKTMFGKRVPNCVKNEDIDFSELDEAEEMLWALYIDGKDVQARWSDLNDAMEIEKLFQKNYPTKTIELKQVKNDLRHIQAMKESFKHYKVKHKKTGKEYKVTAMTDNSALEKARAQHGGTASRYTGTSTNDFEIVESYIKEDIDLSDNMIGEPDSYYDEQERREAFEDLKDALDMVSRDWEKESVMQGVCPNCAGTGYQDGEDEVYNDETDEYEEGNECDGYGQFGCDQGEMTGASWVEIVKHDERSAERDKAKADYPGDEEVIDQIARAVKQLDDPRQMYQYMKADYPFMGVGKRSSLIAQGMKKAGLTSESINEGEERSIIRDACVDRLVDEFRGEEHQFENLGDLEYAIYSEMERMDVEDCVDPDMEVGGQRIGDFASGGVINVIDSSSAIEDVVAQLDTSDLKEGRSSELKLQINKALGEAEYKGKKVQLNKPKRGGSKKYYVYVKNPKTDRVKKISFGDVTGLRTKSGNKKRAKSFAARHNCEKKNDKMKAGYWACRLPRYGLVKGGKWW